MRVLFIFLFYTVLLSFWNWFWCWAMSTGLQFYFTVFINVIVILIGLLFTTTLNNLGYNKKSIFLNNITDITINSCNLALFIDTLLIYTDYFFKGIEDYLVIYALISTTSSIVIVLLYTITLDLCKKTNILSYNILWIMSFWIYLTSDLTGCCFCLLCVVIPLSYAYLIIYSVITPGGSYIDPFIWYENFKLVLKIYFLTNIIQFLVIYIEIYLGILDDLRFNNVVYSVVLSVIIVFYHPEIKNKKLVYLSSIIEFIFLFNFLYFILLLMLVSVLYLSINPIWGIEEFSILLMVIIVCCIIIVEFFLYITS